MDQGLPPRLPATPRSPGRPRPRALGPGTHPRRCTLPLLPFVCLVVVEGFARQVHACSVPFELTFPAGVLEPLLRMQAPVVGPLLLNPPHSPSPPCIVHSPPLPKAQARRTRCRKRSWVLSLRAHLSSRPRWWSGCLQACVLSGRRQPGRPTWHLLRWVGSSATSGVTRFFATSGAACFLGS